VHARVRDDELTEGLGAHLGIGCEGLLLYRAAYAVAGANARDAGVRATVSPGARAFLARDAINVQPRASRVEPTS